MRGFFSQIDSEEHAPRRQRLGGGAGELMRQAVAGGAAVSQVAVSSLTR